MRIKKFENIEEDLGGYEDYFTNLSHDWGVDIESKKLKRLLQIIITIKNTELEKEFPLIEPNIKYPDMMLVVYNGENSELYFKFMSEIVKSIRHLTSSHNELEYISMYEENDRSYPDDYTGPAKLVIQFNIR